MIYTPIAVLAAIAWGGLCGWLRLPHWLGWIGGLLAAGLFLWLMRATLEKAAPADRRRFFWLLAATYAFVAMIAIGLVNIAYALAAWKLRGVAI